MKYILIIFLTGLQLYHLNAQKTIAIPSSPEFENYLYARQHQIETKLYKAAIEGRIKAYKTDSLASVYSLSELKQRGATENFIKKEDNVNATTSIIPFEPKDMQGFMFMQQTGNNPFDVSDKTSLKGMALIFQPIIGSFLANKMPLFWISTQELKITLDAEEMNFLSLIYFYSRNSNYYFDSYWAADAGFDPYWHTNISGGTTLMTDSTLFKRISDMLIYSQFNLEDILYYGRRMDNKALLFDEQQKKYITLDEFDSRYFEKANVLDGNPPKDTIIQIPLKLDKVSSLSYDAQKKINKYQYVIQGEDKKQMKFYIDAAINNQLMSTKPILWFYEDYIRWAKL